MDELDKKLLNALQEHFSLSSRPFLEISRKLSMPEEEVIDRLHKLMDSGVIRKFGAILAPKKMGYKSILAAVAVPEDRIEETAEIINGYTGVTHNYQREGTPNLWFTMTERDDETLENNIIELEAKLGTDIKRLPAVQIFKIGVKYDL